jgi:predicted CopG family antitoxin
MIRKTVTIKDEIYNDLNPEEYNSFSELVSVALKLLIEKKQEEKYKEAMLEASKDPLYKADMREIEKDFSYSDFEIQK